MYNQELDKEIYHVTIIAGEGTCVQDVLTNKEPNGAVIDLIAFKETLKRRYGGYEAQVFVTGLGEYNDNHLTGVTKEVRLYVKEHHGGLLRLVASSFSGRRYFLLFDLKTAELYLTTIRDISTPYAKDRRLSSDRYQNEIINLLVRRQGMYLPVKIVGECLDYVEESVTNELAECLVGIDSFLNVSSKNAVGMVINYKLPVFEAQYRPMFP